MTTGTNNRADGSTQTNLVARGQDASVGRSPLLFYAVGRDQLVAVPRENASAIMDEMRLMEAVVEDYLKSIEELDAYQSNFAALMMARHPMDAANSNDRHTLAERIRQAQSKVDEKNQKLKEVLEPLMDFSSQTNKVMELIPIVRQGSRTEHFRLAYARSHIVKAISEEIPLSSGSGTNGGSESVLSNGQVDWDKLTRQMSDVRGQAKIKLDFPWFDDWLKLDKQTVDLFKWSEEINRNLNDHRPLSVTVGEEHKLGSYKVELDGEAQLMRWTYGSSGLSGEFNPFEGKVTVKAESKAELVLAEAKGRLDYYSPPGGLMLACEVPNNPPMDLGMIRSMVSIQVAGGVGASIAAEVGMNVEMRGGQFQANGTQGEMVEFGLPGEQRMIIPRESKPDADTEVKTSLAAFAGGQAEATVGAQLEWKSPEEGHKFKPFAKAAPGVAALAGLGGNAEFFVRYENGKFKLSIKAGFCLGIGAKGKLDFEVDGDLVLEFAKWVYHQLKNINYRKLFFIDDDAFYALSNIITLSIGYGESLRDFMLETTDLIETRVKSMFSDISVEYTEAIERGDLTEKINANPSILDFSTPETKGVITYWLIQTNVVDEVDPANRRLNIFSDDYEIFSSMIPRKEAIMTVFRKVQSKAEYRKVMERVAKNIGEKTSLEEGERLVMEFLSRGEVPSLPSISSDYPGELRNLRDLYDNVLKETASIGTKVVDNSSFEYGNQRDIAWEFRKPCRNSTQCIFVENNAQYA